MTGSELVVTATAIVGAVTGSASLAWQIINERPRIRVSCGVFDMVADGERSKTNMLVITAYNPGKYPVLLKSGGLLGPKKRKKGSVFIIPEPGRVPITLQPGQETYLYTKVGELKGFKEPYDTAYFWDAAGKCHLPPVPFYRRIRRWLWRRFGR